MFNSPTVVVNIIVQTMQRSVQVVKGFLKRSVEWPICLLEYRPL